MGGKTAWFLGFTALDVTVEDLKNFFGGADTAWSTSVVIFLFSLLLISSSFFLFALLVWVRLMEVRFVNLE